MKERDCDPMGQIPVQIRELIQYAKTIGARMHHQYDIVLKQGGTGSTYAHAVPDHREQDIPADAVNRRFIREGEVMYEDLQRGYREVHYHSKPGESVSTNGEVPYKIENISSAPA